MRFQILRDFHVQHHGPRSLDLQGRAGGVVDLDPNDDTTKSLVATKHLVSAEPKAPKAEPPAEPKAPKAPKADAN